MEISRTLYSDAHTAYEVIYTPDIVFAHRETGDLKLQLLAPVAPDLPPKFEHPLFAKLKKASSSSREKKTPSSPFARACASAKSSESAAVGLSL